LAIPFIIGCGYRLTTSPPEPGMDSVAVPVFENRTFEPTLEARVTERVKARLVSSGPWRVVNNPERAALVIRGAVTGFGVTTLSFEPPAAGLPPTRPLEQRVSITTDVTAASDEYTPLHMTLIGTAEYTETSDSLQTRTAKDRAIEEASDGVAEALVARVRAHRWEKATSSAPEGTPAAP
jgi:hypothetical protein